MITEAQRLKIESLWLDRAKHFDFKPKSVKYAKAEIEFFAGAMSALEALYPNEAKPDLISEAIPPRWFFNAVSGRPIVASVTVSPGALPGTVRID